MIFLCVVVMYTSLFTMVTENFFSKCFRCRGFGCLAKENKIGIIQIERINTNIIFNEAVVPNSTSFSEFVNINVENPKAVVKFVRKVAFPTFAITREMALKIGRASCRERVYI